MRRDQPLGARVVAAHRKITNLRLAAVTALFFGCDTRRVSQCATGLPMKFVKEWEMPDANV
jgi:hypothetical protein